MVIAGSSASWLTRNTGALSLLFSALVALATVAYAVLTRWLVGETVKLRKAQTNPEIAIYVEPQERWIGWLDMVIKNVGSGPARNVKFTINPDPLIGKTKLGELSLFKSGLGYLAPGQTIRFFFGSGPDIMQTLQPFSIVVTCEGAGDESMPQATFAIDLSALADLSQLGTPPIYDIEKHLSQIARDLHSVIGGLGMRLRVETMTNADVVAENERMIAQHDRDVADAKRAARSSKAPAKTRPSKRATPQRDARSD